MFELPLKKVFEAISYEADMDMSQNPLQDRHYVVFIKRPRRCLGECDFVYALKQSLTSDKYRHESPFTNMG